MESASVMHGGDGAAGDPTESPAAADDTYRAHFTAWLGGMSEEARQLAFLLEREEASAPMRRLAADSLNQLLHAAEMLPQGTEALGYLETLFAFRVLAAELSEAAFAAPRLPKPRPPQVAPAAVGPAGTEPLEAELSEGAVDSDSAALEALSSVSDSQSLVSEHSEGEPVVAAPADTEAMAAEPLEAVAAARAAGAEGESGAIELPAGDSSQPELSVAEAVSLEAELSEAELPAGEPAETEPPAADVAAVVAQPEQEWEEPERAQASDESYAVVRRLAPQAALVRAFLGTEDAERLRRLVLEQRNRATRGRSSKEILLGSEARAAAASEARDWADLYEVPEFGSTQHDLLRLRTFMKTRVRRGAS